MKEKLLAALKSKYPGVQEAILDRIATSKAGSVTDEDQVQSVADGVNVQDIINSESDYRASQESKSASKKAVSDYEKKHKLKDGKSIEDPKDPNPKPGDGDGDGEKPPAWAEKLMKDNEELRNEVAQSKKDRESSEKLSKAAELMQSSNKIPETLKVGDKTVKVREKWLKRINPNDEDNSIEDQVKELEDEYGIYNQNSVNSSVDGGGEEPGSNISGEDMDGYLDDKFGGAEGEK